MTVTSRLSRLLAVAACVLLATVNSGCTGGLMTSRRNALQLELNQASQKTARLQAEKKQVQDEIQEEEQKLKDLETRARVKATWLKTLRTRAADEQAELARIQERNRKLDVRIAAARAKPPSGPTVVSSAPPVRALSPADRAALETTVLQLMKLEDWLMAQQRALSDEKYSATKYAWRSERLRAQAHLVGLARMIECLDLPAQVAWLNSHPLPAVNVNAELLGTLATSAGMVRNDILLAAERDASVSPLERMHRIAERAEKLVITSERLGADLMRSDDPQVQALGRECQALAKLFKHVKPVARQGLDMNWQPDTVRDVNISPAKQSVSARLVALWSAKTAVAATPGPDPAYAQTIRTIEFVEWTTSSSWSPEAYLSSRLRAVQRQRFGVANRLASP